MAAGIATHAVGCLGQPENGSQIDEQAAEDERAAEAHQAALARAGSRFAGARQKDTKQDEENEETDDLNGQAGEQDIIPCVGAAIVALGTADEGRPSDLSDGGADITSDKNPNDLAPAETERAQGLAEGGNERGQGGVDAGGEEDRRDDDEEVLDHEIGHAVGIPHGRRRRPQAEHVAHDLAYGGEEAEDGEGPEAVLVESDEVEDESDGVENKGQDGERESGRVAVKEKGQWMKCQKEGKRGRERVCYP